MVSDTTPNDQQAEDPLGTRAMGPLRAVEPDVALDPGSAGAPRFVLVQVCQTLAEQGYDPIHQMVGYLLSGDPAYITSQGRARNLIRKVGRDELLEELVREFVSSGRDGGKA